MHLPSQHRLAESFHTYIQGQIPQESMEFRIAAQILWEEMYPLASMIANKFRNIQLEPEELISTLLIRLLNKRHLPYKEICGISSYIHTSLENIAIDIWRRESRHLAPKTITGERSRTLSLDQEDLSGRTLHDLIAAPQEETSIAWTVLSPIQEQLETHLYEKEIYCLSHRTPKGKRTFEREAILFRKYRDGTYSPTGSPYKKFTRQRKRMLAYLETKRDRLLQANLDAKQFVLTLAETHQLEQLKNNVQEDLDATRKERIIQAHFDLLAFYEYTKDKSYDPSDALAYTLFVQAITSIFQEQLYRTQR